MTDTDESVRVSGVFYKYREFPLDCDELGWKRLELMLSDRQIYFASPKQLNDPFDCFPHVTLEGSTAEIQQKCENYVAEMVEERDRIRVTERHRADPGFQAAVDHLVQDITNQRARSGKLYDQIDKHTGVYCMSTCADSILQWSYYASGHTGFALEFTIPSNSAPPFDMVVGVEYVADRQGVEVFDLLSKNNKSYLWQLVRRKLDRWQHEGEVRAFVTRSGVARFTPDALTSVIFGTKTSPAHKSWIKNTLKQAGLSVRYLQAEQSYSHFQLTLREET